MDRRSFMKAVAVGVCAELLPLTQGMKVGKQHDYRSYPKFMWHEAEVVCKTEQLLNEYSEALGTVSPYTTLLPMPDGEPIQMPRGTLIIQGLCGRERADGQYLLTVSFGRCPSGSAVFHETSKNNDIWKHAKWSKPRGINA